MQRGVAATRRTIRIPVHVVEREQQVVRARGATSWLEHNRPASDEELAGRTRLSVKHIREVHDAARAVTSLANRSARMSRARRGFAADGNTPAEEVKVPTKVALHRALKPCRPPPHGPDASVRPRRRRGAATLDRSPASWASPASASARSASKRATSLAELRELEGLAPAAAA